MEFGPARLGFRDQLQLSFGDRSPSARRS